MRRYSRIETPDDLARVRILHERDYADWNFWLKCHPCKGLNLNDGHVVGESNVLMSLAISGVGVALCGLSLVREHIASGALVLPLPTHKVRHYKAYYILTRKNQKISSQAKAFIEYLHAISLVE
ncbi:LysR substrate-binding domain-containing protein [Klebsiella sp. WOUb02]|uniref:LysR substrate-binding domain-containing protein n=1 Tax=Klebsiella sp. WOUb02 TaxID=3161071 RepID=UPI003CE8D76B